MALSATTIDRLKSQLLTSGLQQKDNALYQVINQLIDAVKSVTSDVASGSGGGGGGGGVVNNFITNETIISPFDGIDGEDGLDSLVPGEPGLKGSQGNPGPMGISVPGFDGNDGEDGLDSLIPGEPGLRGTNGSRGADGITIPGWDGFDGEDGIDGNPGLPGTPGQNGTSTFFLSGSGNPQGVQSAAIGTFYVDTSTGYVYKKEGGGSTAYGWYLIPPAGFPGPLPWRAYAVNGVAGGGGNLILATNLGPLGITDNLGINTFSTPTGITTSSRVVNGSKTFNVMTSAATTGTNTYFNNTSTNNALFFDDDVDLFAHILTGGDVSNIRIWFGFTSSVITNTATLGSGTTGSMCIRYGTPEGDAGWRGATQLNGAGNQTLTSNAGTALGAIAANTQYRLRIRFVRQGTPTVFFSVNDGTEASVTTNINATGVSWFFIFGFTCQANSARSLGYRSIGANFGS